VRQRQCDIDRDKCVPEGVTDEKLSRRTRAVESIRVHGRRSHGPGPMQNIMKEMGLVPPTLPSGEMKNSYDFFFM
jgi:hypothetical protein